MISFCITISWSNINSMSISVNNSNFTSVFLKLLARLIRELKEILFGLIDKFQLIIDKTHFSNVFKNVS